MLFNSIEFAIFLPIVFILYWFVFNRNLRLQNLFLVVVSYIFYGWWNWKYLVLIAFTSFISYLSGILIGKYRNHKRISLAINTTNIIVNLFILGVFKYYNFFIQSFADLFLNGQTDGLLVRVILPVGISFYTFQALSYSIDVYRGKMQPTKDIVAFFAFLSFFPQLVAGPIERATNLLTQFYTRRVFDYDRAVDGVSEIIWGLFKKVAIADACAIYVNHVFHDYASQNASTLLLGAICFAIQIYCDFSGYSHIAIGTARLFGISLMKNFNFPYFSRDIAEFWRRWHISLTTWFRDYLYIPLGGSRNGKAKTIRNTFIIFLVSGLWHGANWTFIVWGLFHAILFLPLLILNKNRCNMDTVAANKFLPSGKEALQIIFTFFLTVIGWIIFRSETISDSYAYIVSLFDLSLFTLPDIKHFIHPVLLIISVFILIIMEWINRNQSHAMYGIKPVYLIPLSYLLIGLIFFNIGNESAFIYFQF